MAQDGYTLIEDFDYRLPEHAIAQTPLFERDQSRMLVDINGLKLAHHKVCDLPMFIRPGDLLVLNNTRVLPARLRLKRQSGGAVEVLLLESRAPDAALNACGTLWEWEALVRPSKRVQPGEVLRFNETKLGQLGKAKLRQYQLVVKVGEHLGEGRRLVRLGMLGVSGMSSTSKSSASLSSVEGSNQSGGIGSSGANIMSELLRELGEVPLPPYIHASAQDIEQYQTVFGKRSLSAAAPTAGRHFTFDLIDRVKAAGAKVATVELAIGLDTFRPISSKKIADHVMHTERYLIPATTSDLLSEARRVIAVGTTVVRTLETFALTGKLDGRSGLFIRRPFNWQKVDMMLTNFHLPRSSLLCLVDAFIGSRWRYLYSEALSTGYRFLSFGDAMLLTRRCE